MKSKSTPVTFSPVSTFEIAGTTAPVDAEPSAPGEPPEPDEGVKPSPQTDSMSTPEDTPVPTENKVTLAESAPRNTPTLTGIAELSPTLEPSPTHGSNETSPYPIG